MLTENRITDRNQNGHIIKEDSSNRKAFAELLDEYAPEPLHRGQFVDGEIIQIDHNVILADVDAKRTAVVPPQDLAEIEEVFLDQLSVGDEVTLYVIRTPRGNDDLLVSLNKGLERKDWQRARTYLENEESLELEITGYNKGGLMVDFGHLDGFVPASHVPQLKNTYDKQAIISRKAGLVGQEMPFQVIEVDRRRERLILSAKKARKEIRQQRLRELQSMEGTVISGRVSNLVSFGAFVDLDGVEGLIHISEISWGKTERAADILSKGDEVEVLIQSVDVDRERVSLSRKSLLPSPWDSYSQKHVPGDLVEGVVTGVADFGAFVRVAEGIEGLVHISEMRGAQDFAAKDLLYPGDTILVRILKIEPEQQRLSLSQRRVRSHEEMDWIQTRQPSETEPLNHAEAL